MYFRVGNVPRNEPGGILGVYALKFPAMIKSPNLEAKSKP